MERAEIPQACTHSMKRQQASRQQQGGDRVEKLNMHERPWVGEPMCVCVCLCVYRGHWKDGSALENEQKDPSKKTRAPAGMQAQPKLASQEEAREFPLQLGGGACCRQPDMMTGAGKTSAWKEEGRGQWQ